jgi:hypothetical protein
MRFDDAIKIDVRVRIEHVVHDGADIDKPIDEVVDPWPEELRPEICRFMVIATQDWLKPARWIRGQSLPGVPEYPC